MTRPTSPETHGLTEESQAARTIRLIREDERARCISIIRQYLLFNDQRAVSWHEVQDAIDAIRQSAPGGEGKHER